MNTHKLAIGTAQFGLSYGINNAQGQVSAQEISDILNLAQGHGVVCIDTAIAYGDSESALGANNLCNFDLITKLPEAPSQKALVKTWVLEQITESRARLNIQQLDAILLHRPPQLLSEEGEELYSALLALKQAGQCRRIGVSIYSPQELDLLTQHFDLDLVQLPMNVFDQRALQSGWLKRLQDKNIAVHVRSLFLQGLLLMDASKRPEKFNQWQLQWQKWEHWLRDNQLSPLEGCLRPFLAMDGIERLVIGIDSSLQFQEIIDVFSKVPLPLPEQLSCQDEKLLNPALWN